MVLTLHADHATTDYVIDSLTKYIRPHNFINKINDGEEFEQSVFFTLRVLPLICDNDYLRSNEGEKVNPTLVGNQIWFSKTCAVVSQTAKPIRLILASIWAG